MEVVTERLNKQNSIAIERLTALWALNESGLGGILHALQLPFKGVVLTGFAVILITMIGYYSERKSRDILKAMIIVLIIKAMVSPHTPVTAYLAVGFQGLLGAFLFQYIRNLRAAALILASLAFLESAVQRLVVMTVVFGNPLWESIDVFFNFILRELHLIGEGDNARASFWIITFYVGTYILTGVLAGLFSGNLPGSISRAGDKIRIPFSNVVDEAVIRKDSKKKRPFWKRKKLQLFGILILITLILYLLSEQYQWTIGIYIFTRTLLVIGIWYLLLAPVLLKGLMKILRRKKRKYSEEVERTLLYLPEFRAVIRWAWSNARMEKGIKRITLLIRLILWQILAGEEMN